MAKRNYKYVHSIKYLDIFCHGMELKRSWTVCYLLEMNEIEFPLSQLQSIKLLWKENNMKTLSGFI